MSIAACCLLPIAKAGRVQKSMSFSRNTTFCRFSNGSCFVTRVPVCHCRARYTVETLIVSAGFHKGSPEVEEWGLLSQLIGTASSEAILPSFRRDFLPVLDQLRGMETDKRKKAEGIWLHLARQNGLEEKSMRDALQMQRRMARGGMVGCSWLKCVMYRKESDKEMFRCAGCQLAKYCAEACQNR